MRGRAKRLNLRLVLLSTALLALYVMFRFDRLPTVITISTQEEALPRVIIIPRSIDPSHEYESRSHQHGNITMVKLMEESALHGVDQVNLQSIVKAAQLSYNNTAGKITNPHPFRYIITAQNICRGKEVFLLIYVHSAPAHYKRRSVIRQTWGSDKHYDVPVKVVFIMGRNSEKVQSAVAFESERYGDIVQEDFLDTYRNLTYKGIAALKWISSFCSHASYILKTDDDIFVNTFTLIRHLKSFVKYQVNRRGLLLCLVWYRMPVLRKGKWGISKEMYKDDFYPTYCSGSAFTFSTDVAIRLHAVSYYVPFFWVDDFYITGLLPLRANVTHKQFMSTYVLNGMLLEKRFTGPQWFTYVFSHLHDLDRILRVWHRLIRLNSGIETPEFQKADPGKIPAYVENVAKPLARKGDLMRRSNRLNDDRNKTNDKAKIIQKHRN